MTTTQITTRAADLGLTLSLTAGYSAEQLSVYLDDPAKAPLPRGVRRVDDQLVSPSIAEAAAKLDDAQAKARTRCLGVSDLVEVERRYQAARRLARLVGMDPDGCEAETDAGGVSNSYRGIAFTSYARRGKYGWRIGRTHARSGPYGRCITERIWCPLPDDGGPADREAVKVLKSRTPKGWPTPRRDNGRYSWKW